MYWLEQVIETGGQLLRVQRYIDRRSGQKRDTDLLPGLLFTFDVGRILIWGNSENDSLQCDYIKEVEDVPQSLKTLDETEPWWRIIGSPLVCMERMEKTNGFRLQFREGNHNPRFILLTNENGFIRVALENPPKRRE